MENVRIRYLGHSCFRLEYGGQSLVLDPYLDGMVPGLDPVREEADFVWCSHGHDDHNYVKALRVRGGEPGFSLEELVTDHDPEGGRLRGKNTVRIFGFGPFRVAHMGDLGRLLTAEETEKLSGLDAVLLPVGGHYTIDPPTAKAVTEAIRPRVLIPMHYRTDTTGFGNIAHIDSFTGLFGRVEHYGPDFLLTEDTPAQVALLTQALARA